MTVTGVAGTSANVAGPDTARVCDRAPVTSGEPPRETSTVPDSPGRAVAPIRSARCRTSASRRSASSLGEFPATVAVLMLSLRAAMFFAVALTSSTIAPSCSRAVPHCAANASAAWLNPLAMVATRCTSWLRGAGSSGWFPTSSQPAQNSDSCCSPLSLGSVNVCSR